MRQSEEGVVLSEGSEFIVGVFHQPIEPIGVTVVIVVGGPQYRVGSHRQFVLTARALAVSGIHVLRFDLPGMGDSSGDPIEFAQAPKFVARVSNWARARLPNNRLVLYGLCDSASANLLTVPLLDSAHLDGMICVNPWVRREHTEAKTRIRHYYLARLFSSETWKKLGRFQLDLKSSIGEVGGTLKRSIANGGGEQDFVDTMRNGMSILHCPMLFILSGDDLTAQEFSTLVRNERMWGKLMKDARVTVQHIEDADHTFSDRKSLELHNRICADWLSRVTATGGQS